MLQHANKLCLLRVVEGIGFHGHEWLCTKSPLLSLRSRPKHKALGRKPQVSKRRSFKPANAGDRTMRQSANKFRAGRVPPISSARIAVLALGLTPQALCFAPATQAKTDFLCKAGTNTTVYTGGFLNLWLQRSTKIMRKPPTLVRWSFTERGQVETETPPHTCVKQVISVEIGL